MSLILSPFLRTDRTVRPLAVYFILNNRIYQSPDVYNLMSNRLVSPCIYVYPILGRLMTTVLHVTADVSTIAAKIPRHSPITQTRVHAAHRLCVAHCRAAIRGRLSGEEARSGRRRGSRTPNARARGPSRCTRTLCCFQRRKTAAEQHAVLERHADYSSTCTRVLSITDTCSRGDRPGNTCSHCDTIVCYPGTWPGRACDQGLIHSPYTPGSNQRSARGWKEEKEA